MEHFISILFIRLPFTVEAKDWWAFGLLAIASREDIGSVKSALPIHKEFFAHVHFARPSWIIDEDQLSCIPVTHALRDHLICPWRVRDDGIRELFQEADTQR